VHYHFGTLFPDNLTVQSCDPPRLKRWDVTDRILRPLFYVDGAHVGPNINEEFNHMLLDLICKDDQ